MGFWVEINPPKSLLIMMWFWGCTPPVSKLKICHYRRKRSL